MEGAAPRGIEIAGCADLRPTSNTTDRIEQQLRAMVDLRTCAGTAIDQFRSDRLGAGQFSGRHDREESIPIGVSSGECVNSSALDAPPRTSGAAMRTRQRPKPEPKQDPRRSPRDEQEMLIAELRRLGPRRVVPITRTTRSEDRRS